MIGFISQERLLGDGRQPSGPCAAQNTAWYHQHLDTMNETGGECGQNRGSQKRSAFHPPSCVTTKEWNIHSR